MLRNSIITVRCMTSYQANNGYPILRCLKNYYEVLEVPLNCSKSDIKRAYIELSKKYHPDGSSISSNSEEFVKVCEAYKILYKRISCDSNRNRHRSSNNMVPTMDLSYSNRNVHKSWKKYQAAIRYKQFVPKIPSFRGNIIKQMNPVATKSKSKCNSTLTVIPPMFSGNESDDEEEDECFQSNDNSVLLTYYLTGLSIVGVLLAYEFINKSKRQNHKIPMQHSL